MAKFLLSKENLTESTWKSPTTDTGPHDKNRGRFGFVTIQL
ncbi:hypothetical protein HNQ92_001945 [Rhabdobacter roseus]|uniref:Uncharacterized protein n=1 Tax=Rhabdobacter roseus TaxID=1655419 RepID=A0A840TVZ1_9BACT|nr:hypothetical protein [Rhabdobacter roseus]